MGGGSYLMITVNIPHDVWKYQFRSSKPKHLSRDSPFFFFFPAQSGQNPTNGPQSSGHHVKRRRFETAGAEGLHHIPAIHSPAGDSILLPCLSPIFPVLLGFFSRWYVLYGGMYRLFLKVFFESIPFFGGVAVGVPFSSLLLSHIDKAMPKRTSVTSHHCPPSPHHL